MRKVKITAVKKIQHLDLIEQYENPIEHTCDIQEGQTQISIDGKYPKGLCLEAWKSMKEFVEALSRGEGNFFDGWMKNPDSAMISCNDGFRPVSFYISVIDQIKNYYYQIMPVNKNALLRYRILDRCFSDLAQLESKGIVHAIRCQNDMQEATGAYKDIDEVIANELDLVKVKTKLLPIAVLKG